MKNLSRIALLSLFLSVLAANSYAANPKAVIETTMGNIEIELFEDKAPISVKNFIAYANEGFYNGTIFHRVIKRFMIQTGGLDAKMNKKETKAPITNEADNKIPNMKGTVAMARTGQPHSATSQFFINTKTNDFLNFKDKTQRAWGYAVFAKVTKGMDIVTKIEMAKTEVKDGRRDVPVDTIEIKNVRIIK